MCPPRTAVAVPQLPPLSGPGPLRGRRSDAAFSLGQRWRQPAEPQRRWPAGTRSDVPTPAPTLSSLGSQIFLLIHQATELLPVHLLRASNATLSGGRLSPARW